VGSKFDRADSSQRGLAGILSKRSNPETMPLYRCPAGEKPTYRYTNAEDGKALRRYWTTACSSCPLKARCTTGSERRTTRWEHEHVLEAVEQRLDRNPQAMRVRRETVEHPFGTLKMRMGATHFLMKTLPRVATEMALHVVDCEEAPFTRRQVWALPRAAPK
jgi:Transposase DDE domain